MSSLRSPRFRFDVPSGLAVGASATFDLKTGMPGQYAPLNSIEIQNFSTQKLVVSAGDAQLVVAPNSAYTAQIFGLNRVTVTNIGVTATDADVNIIVWQDVTGDMCLISQTLGVPMSKVVKGEY